MTTSQSYQDNSKTRQRLAAEVIELGESLFEMAIEAGVHQPEVYAEMTTYPIKELQEATNEFFTALRLLLGIAE